MPPDKKGDYRGGLWQAAPPHPFSREASPAIPAAGRPGAKNMKTLLSEALNECVIVTENGGRRQGHQARSDHQAAGQPIGHSRLAGPSRSCSTCYGRSKARTEPASSRNLRLQRGGREGHRAAQGALLESGKVMIENLTRAPVRDRTAAGLRHLRRALFSMDLNPQAVLAMNWHLQVIAAKLTAVREGKIRRLIIKPAAPATSKSLMASIAFSSLVSGTRSLGPDPLRQPMAQDPRPTKLARDLPQHHDEPVVSAESFPTRLAPHRQAVQEFITTRQGYRLATSTGGRADRTRVGKPSSSVFLLRLSQTPR